MASKQTRKTRSKPAKKRPGARRGTPKKPRKKARKKTQHHSYLRRLLGFSFRYLLLPGLFIIGIGVFVLDNVVRTKFSGSKWTLPTHVYSRTLDLYAGLEITKENLIWELDQLGYRRVQTVSRPGQYAVGSWAIELQSRPFVFLDGDKPSQQARLTFNDGQLISLANDQGKSLPLLRLEPVKIGGIYPERAEDRILVRLEDLPPYLADAIVAVEDRHFYQHHGISLTGIARAMWVNLRKGKFAQGGSTITQQLVKNFYLTRERSLSRKALEAMMAVLLELHYSKAEILEAYINEIYLGQSGKRAIHGFGIASEYYFRQPLAELDVHQVALLVALTKGASYYNPRKNPMRATTRRNVVLRLLKEQEIITADIARQASAKKLDVTKTPGTNTNKYPDYLDLVKRHLREDYDDEDLSQEGLRIFTYFDPQIQREVENRLSHRLTRIETQRKLDKNSLEAASLVVRVGSGEILALAGSRERRFAGFNRALDARRMIGSTIKPAVYLAALERPQQFTLGSMIEDGPISVEARKDEMWTPRNFDRISHGPVPLYAALGNSYNQATARLGLNVGLSEVADVIRRLGFQGTIPEVPALLLGGIAMTPYEVASLYHTIASEGFYTPLRAINAVYSADNRALNRYPFKVEQRFSATSIHLLHYALQVVMREGTGRSAYVQLPEALVLAGKTGTSNDQRDSWFSGFSGNYLTVVWMGRDDNGPTPITGSSGALQGWSDIMSGLDNQSIPFTPPEGITYSWYDPETGLASEEHCTKARYLPFITGSEPRGKTPCQGKFESDVVDWLRRWLPLN